MLMFKAMFCLYISKLQWKTEYLVRGKKNKTTGFIMEDEATFSLQPSVCHA